MKEKPKRHVSRRYVRFACTYDGLWSSHVLGFGRATVAVVESEAVESNGGKRDGESGSKWVDLTWFSKRKITHNEQENEKERRGRKKRERKKREKRGERKREESELPPTSGVALLKKYT